MAENLQYYCACNTAIGIAATPGQRAAVYKPAMWDKNASISARFLGGSESLKARVMSVAREWEAFAPLTFDFRNEGPTDIRIDFMPGMGSWSYLGSICRQIGEPEATMNYGWLTDSSTEDELRSVVLHEFGHAIGLIHEHQNPQGGIKWNKEAVIADLSGPPNNWSLATIESNMFLYYPNDQVIASPVDASSIMMYPIPKAWTLDGFSAGLNSELSAIDKFLVADAYN